MYYTCPNCHGKLILFTTDLTFNYSKYYCPSLRCKVKYCIFFNGRLIHVKYYKSLERKRKAVLSAIRNNFSRYSPKAKRKLKSKYLQSLNL